VIRWHSSGVRLARVPVIESSGIRDGVIDVLDGTAGQCHEGSGPRSGTLFGKRPDGWSQAVPAGRIPVSGGSRIRSVRGLRRTALIPGRDAGASCQRPHLGGIRAAPPPPKACPAVLHRPRRDQRPDPAGTGSESNIHWAARARPEARNGTGSSPEVLLMSDCEARHADAAGSRQLVLSRSTTQTPLRGRRGFRGAGAVAGQRR
jgi:hypothetical protein